MLRGSAISALIRGDHNTPAPARNSCLGNAYPAFVICTCLSSHLEYRRSRGLLLRIGDCRNSAGLISHHQHSRSRCFRGSNPVWHVRLKSRDIGAFVPMLGVGVGVPATTLTSNCRPLDVQTRYLRTPGCGATTRAMSPTTKDAPSAEAWTQPSFGQSYVQKMPRIVVQLSVYHVCQH